ncbi:hypothetical protein [Thiomicrorhabdus sp.]|uniref:hypothetical protein n=1 Tax=Thiomicrorhabdus sp. TaxID=2039724 RepID=UPI00163D7795|nr:hypothetical protein [Thiomicrorhabdus sp.]
MKLFLKIAFFLSLVLANNVYAACTQTGNSIGLMGLAGSGQIYASLSSHDNQCACNQARFYSKNADLDMVLSILMSAKLSGKKVRIDFLNYGQCSDAFKVFIH